MGQMTERRRAQESALVSAQEELAAYRALFDAFVENGTWHDVGPKLNATELDLVVEAARASGRTEWAEEFERSAREEYDPEGYESE